MGQWTGSQLQRRRWAGRTRNLSHTQECVRQRVRHVCDRFHLYIFLNIKYL